MFSVEAEINLDAIAGMITGGVDSWIDDTIEDIFGVGKKLVDDARAKTKEENGFGNITWNLRGSIGCGIIYEGSIKKTYFPPINGGTVGEQVGLSYLQEIAVLVDEPGQVILLFVAGMEYASFVQTVKRDVIYHVIGDNLADALKTIMQ